ncbi:MAG: lipase family protein [Betaproteobacteria bacterium]
MPRSRPYDPTWHALLCPGAARDFFAAGRPASELLLCAELARLAYVGFDRSPAEAQRAEGLLREAGFDSVRFLSRRGTECFVARDHTARLTVVSFRGTASLLDLAMDLATWRVRWSAGGRVHAGFACALRPVWGELVHALSHEAHEGSRLVFTGHSLGAALATLAATLMPPAALYTFGSPRVGDARFVELLRDVPFVRTTDCADLVCHVPPAWLGFAHGGALTYLDRRGDVHTAADATAIRADRMIARREYLRTLAWRIGNACSRRFADHAPVNYVTPTGM